MSGCCVMDRGCRAAAMSRVINSEQQSRHHPSSHHLSVIAEPRTMGGPVIVRYDLLGDNGSFCYDTTVSTVHVVNTNFNLRNQTYLRNMFTFNDCIAMYYIGEHVVSKVFEWNLGTMNGFNKVRSSSYKGSGNWIPRGG